MRSLLILGYFMCASLMAQAQFMSTYTTGTSDVIFNAVQVYEGNILVAGNEGNHILLVRYNTAGDVLDSQVFTVIDDSLLPYVCTMIVDSDGKIVLAGHRNTGAEFSSSAFICKYDYNTSTVLWAKEVQNPGSSFYKVIEKKAGSVYLVCGQSYNTPNAEEGIVYTVNRTTGSLTVLNNSNENASSDTYYSMVRVGNAYYMSARYNYNAGGSGRMRGALTKISQSGTELFSKAYFRDLTTATARLHSVDLSYAANALYMTAHGDETGVILNKDLLMVKTKTDGEVHWANAYDFTSYEKDGSWRSIEAKGQYVYAYGNQYNLGTGNMFLMKLDTAGSVVWANSYNALGNKSNSPDAMLLYGSNIFMTGYVNDDATPYSNGILVCVKSANGTLPDDCSTAEPISVIPKSEVAYSNALTPVTHTYTITSPPSSPESHSWTAITTCSNDLRIAEEASTLSIYPNPATNLLNISSVYSSYQISIITTEGKELLRTLSDNQTTQIDISTLPSGIYLLKIETPDASEIQMVVMM